MKIVNDVSLSANNETITANETTKSEHLKNVKSFGTLTPGDKFKATIVDIQMNLVKLKLPNGETLTAKSMILPEARIGEDTIFLVKENAKGQILLEMVKSEGSQLVNGIVKNALLSAGMFSTKENMDLVKSLMENDLPIDAETIQKAAFFKYTKENMTIDKIIFLLKEEFPTIEKNVSMINQLMDKTIGMKQNLESLVDQLLSLSEDNLAEDKPYIDIDGVKKEIFETILKSNDDYTKSREVFELLEKVYSNTGDKEIHLKQLEVLIKQRLFIDLDTKDGKDIKNINEYYKDTFELLTKLKEVLDNNGIKSDIPKQINNVQENIQFMNGINNYKEYLQIPFTLNGNENQGELHIFKDSKGAKNFKENANVLIALDLANLGHIEIFINKVKNSLGFQFKCENNEISKAISANKDKLEQLLAEKNYSISGISFKKLNESFRLTDHIKNSNDGNTKRRYSFDMRV